MSRMVHIGMESSAQVSSCEGVMVRRYLSLYFAILYV